MSEQLRSEAWQFHQGTKHPGGWLLDPGHRYDWHSRPFPYKEYAEAPLLSLPPARAALGAGALATLAAAETGPGEETGVQIPDRAALAKLLYLSAGITKRIDYGPPAGEIAFRAASCTGALYHIELYLVCGPLPDLDAGVYHYDVRAHGLRRLREGDFRQQLVAASGQHPAVARAPVLFLYSSVVGRNAVKYQARAYRHAFWDSGTILAHSLAVAAGMAVPAQVIAGFVDDVVNDLLGLDPARELMLALVPLGRADDPPPPAPPLSPLAWEPTAGARAGRIWPAIVKIQDASSLPRAEAVRTWRAQVARAPRPTPSAQQASLPAPLAAGGATADLAQVILRRGSSRRFRQAPIGHEALATMLHVATAPVPGDWGSGASLALNEAYVIATNVEGLAPGAYRYLREAQAVELLAPEARARLRAMAGQLALGQDLGADAAANIYFLSNLPFVLQTYGDRGYRAAQLEAGIAGGRLYLAAYALGLGATGLTFYDDAVSRFFAPDAEGEEGIFARSPLFLVAVGVPAPRR